MSLQALTVSPKNDLLTVSPGVALFSQLIETQHLTSSSDESTTGGSLELGVAICLLVHLLRIDEVELEYVLLDVFGLEARSCNEEELSLIHI